MASNRSVPFRHNIFAQGPPMPQPHRHPLLCVHFPENHIFNPVVSLDAIYNQDVDATLQRICWNKKVADRHEKLTAAECATLRAIFQRYSLSQHGFVFTLRSLLHYFPYTLIWEDDDDDAEVV